jgi:GNAT superfamily N-acetyltransferase
VTGAADDILVRAATARELPAVLNVLDGAALRTDAGRVREAIDRGDALVAVARDDTATGDADGTRVLGALVLDGPEITAVAVRRRRRGQGIGRALVEAAAARRERLVAECDPNVAPFWRTLGFACSPVDSAEGGDEDRLRLRGVRE